jgi:hypothetical protein
MRALGCSTGGNDRSGRQNAMLLVQLGAQMVVPLPSWWDPRMWPVKQHVLVCMGPMLTFAQRSTGD